MDDDVYSLIDNLIAIGTVTQADSTKMLAKVKIGDLETDFLPAFSISNKLIKIFVPLQVGEQVGVISPYGDIDGGIIIRSIFNKGCKEPTWANTTTAGVEFNDGTKIIYDSASKLLDIDCKGEIKIKATSIKLIGNLEIEGDTKVNGNLTASGVIKDSDGNNGA